LKRLTTILLLALYINSYTEFHELLRLPVLLEHFHEHQLLVKDLTFLEFLSLHYKSDQSHDSQDNKLPFKDAQHSYTVPAMALPIQKIVMEEKLPCTEITHSSAYHETNIAFHFSDIFQPPRLV
jgi:hypothetical protein